MKSCGVTIQMKATEQYFPVVLLIKLYKVVLTFESVDEILWCDHSNESYWAVLFHLGFTKNSYFLSCLVRRDYSNLIFISARDKEKASPFHAFHCIPTIPEACVPFRYWPVRQTCWQSLYHQPPFANCAQFTDEGLDASLSAFFVENFMLLWYENESPALPAVIRQSKNVT